MRQPNANDLATDNQQLDHIAATLNQLPRKERSLRERITYLSPAILEALAKGYSYSDMTTLLKSQGVDISVSTLKQYLYRFRKDTDTAESASEPSSASPMIAPVTPPTQKRRSVDMPQEL
jgi:DNA-directed RNA polymerase specialized sigma24 family protein